MGLHVLWKLAFCVLGERGSCSLGVLVSLLHNNLRVGLGVFFCLFLDLIFVVVDEIKALPELIDLRVLILIQGHVDVFIVVKTPAVVFVHV